MISLAVNAKEVFSTGVVRGPADPTGEVLRNLPLEAIRLSEAVESAKHNQNVMQDGRSGPVCGGEDRLNLRQELTVKPDFED